MKYALTALALIFTTPAFAQSKPQPAKMGITHTTNPEVVSVLSDAGVWSTMGSINKSNNIFTPVGGGGGGGGIADAPNDGTLYGRESLGWSHILHSDITDWAAVLGLYAPLASPVFTGTPALPAGTVGVTQSPGNNSTSLATTAFVTAAVASGVGSGGISDAPNDGTLYARKSLGWAHILHTDITDWTATLAPYAPIASPTFTGTPTLPPGSIGSTQSPGNNTTALATTAFVTAAVTAGGGALPSNANPIMDGIAASGTSALYSRADHVHPSDTSRAPVASPTFTGTVTIPAGASIAGYLPTATAASTYAPIASPTFTGTVTIPSGANIFGYATTASLAPYAPLASPTFTGTPSLPIGSIGVTQTPGNNTTSLATTAFVGAAVAAGSGASPSNANPLMDGVAAPGVSPLFSRADHVHPTDTSRAPVASPTFTGTVTIPPGASIAGYAPLASPTFTGAPSLPTGAIGVTQPPGDNGPALATTAFVTAAAAGGGTTFTPASVYSSTLNVTTTSASVPFPAGTTTGSVIKVYNTGATQAYWTIGNSSVAATPGMAQLDPYSWDSFTVPAGATNLAAVTRISGQVTSLNLELGTGTPSGNGGPINLSVAAPGVQAAFWNVIGGVDNTNAVARLGATAAGTSTTNSALAIQGITGAVPVKTVDSGTPITAAPALGAGGGGIIGWLSQIFTAQTNGTDANNNAKTATATNVTPINCSGGSAGTTAANAPNLGTANIHGFTFQNLHATNTLCISLTGTASCGAAGSYTMVGLTQTGPNSYTTPNGLGSNAAVSVIASAASTPYTCTAW